MTDFQIYPLFEKPQFTDTCAAWFYGEWSSQLGRPSIDPVRNMFKDVANVKTDTQADHMTGLIRNSWIGISKNKPAGMVSIGNRGTINAKPDAAPTLFCLYVHPNFRGQSYASLLEQTASEWTRSEGEKIMYLDTEQNPAFYERMGWNVIETHPDSYGRPNFKTRVMEKVLN